MVLWRMVSKSDQANSQIFGMSELARGKNIGADFLDILSRGTDIGPLTSRTVLNGAIQFTIARNENVPIIRYLYENEVAIHDVG